MSYCGDEALIGLAVATRASLGFLRLLPLLLEILFHFRVNKPLRPLPINNTGNRFVYPLPLLGCGLL